VERYFKNPGSGSGFYLYMTPVFPIRVYIGANDGPDKQHEARRSPKRDDEGTKDRQSQEVREDLVTVVSV